MPNAQSDEGKLRKNSIGVLHIVFFVVAAAAPMAAVVGATPPAFIFGNGAGVPGTFLLGGLLYFVFSIGFTSMSRFVSGAGAFYTYIAQGLGKPLGVAGALIAILSYNASEISLYAILGVFLEGAFAPLGLTFPWWFYATLSVLIVTICGRRNVVFSGNLLGVCMVAEIAILLLLDIAIMVHGGPEGLNLRPFAPSIVFVPSIGVSIVFIVTAYMGFEATAIFSEEARNPERTIPRATFVAVLLITVFYAFSTWAITEYYGPTHVAAQAKAHTATFYLGAADALLGQWTSEIMRILLITSCFACCLSFHNTINRYFFALGREGLAWKRMGSIHPAHGTPAIAGLVQSLMMLIALWAFAAAGQDPYTVIFPWTAALAVMGLLSVQTMVCFAVIGFFRKDSRGIGIGKRLVAPIASSIGLIGALVMVIKNLSILSGSDSPIVAAFPYLVLAVGLFGTGMTLKIKYSQPNLYAMLGRVFEPS